MANVRKEQYEKCINQFARFDRLRRQLIGKYVDTLGLRGSQHSMLIEASRDSRLCQKDLAEKMEISPAAVTVTLKKLETQGYIERTPSSDDSRVNNIAITSKGKNIVKKTNDFYGVIDETAFEGFSDEEIAAFSGYMKRLIENLKAYANAKN